MIGDRPARIDTQRFSSPLEAAHVYLARKWQPLPIAPINGHPTKGPTLPRWQYFRCASHEVAAHFHEHDNIGILLGEPSDWLVDVDLDTDEAAVVGMLLLPETGLVSGRQKRAKTHYWYRSPGATTKKFQIRGTPHHGKATLLELRSTGGQTVVEPSIHDKDADRYYWHTFSAPVEIEASLLMRTCQKVAIGALISTFWQTPGTRHDLTLPLAGLFVYAGWDEEAACEVIEAAATAAGHNDVADRLNVVRDTYQRYAVQQKIQGAPSLKEYFPESVAAQLIEWVRELAPRKNGTIYTDAAIETEHKYTDLGNAERFIDRFGENVRYCTVWKSWLQWTGNRWAEISEPTVMKLASETIRSLYMEATSWTAEASEIAGSTDVEREARQALAGRSSRLLRHAERSESEPRLRAMVSLARTLCEIGPSALDQEQWALNCENGTLDLRTCELAEPRRQDYHTKLVPLTYDPAARCPLWLHFLDQIFQQQSELIQFVQRAVGYSLTGATGEECLFFCYGTGRNGKSKFLTTIQALLGDYATTVAFSSFLHKDREVIREDLAQLQGIRLVTATEVNEDRRFDEGLIKSLTGGDKIRARKLFSQSFTFLPRFKIWIAANHKPEIRGTDAAIWERLYLIPFDVYIPPEERDKDLGAKLLSELPGILVWALEGCFQWQNEGLNPPQAVTEATEGYKQEMDTVAGFIAECCKSHSEASGYSTPSSDLYAAYRRWCEQNGERVLSQHALASRLKILGFQNERSSVTGRRTWKNIIMIAENED